MKTLTNQTILKTPKDADQFWAAFFSQTTPVIDMLIAADQYYHPEFIQKAVNSDSSVESTVSQSMALEAINAFMHAYSDEIDIVLGRDMVTRGVEMQLLVFGDDVTKANANLLKDTAPPFIPWNIKVVSQSRDKVVPNALLCINEIHFEILPDAGNKLLAGCQIAGKPSLKVYVKDVNWIADDAAERVVSLLLKENDMIKRFSGIDVSFDTTENYERGQSMDVFFDALDAFFGIAATTH